MHSFPLALQGEGGGSLIRLIEETRLGAGVAGGTGRPDPQEHSVEVTVEPYLHDFHRVSRGCSLLPQTAFPGKKPGPPGLVGLRPSPLALVAHHQHNARPPVLTAP